MERVSWEQYRLSIESAKDVDKEGTPINEYRIPVKIWANLGIRERQLIEKWVKTSEGKKWLETGIDETDYFDSFPAIKKYLYFRDKN